MKMSLKLAYCAFSLSSSQDAKYDEYLLWFFFTICWSLNLLMSFFSSKTWLQISLCVARVCVYIHWIKTSLKLSHWHFLPVPFSQKMVGWVAFKVSLRFMLRFKPLKCNGQCLYIIQFLLCVWKVIPYRRGMYRGECTHCRSLRQNSIHSL